MRGYENNHLKILYIVEQWLMQKAITSKRWYTSFSVLLLIGICKGFWIIFFLHLLRIASSCLIKWESQYLYDLLGVLWWVIWRLYLIIWSTAVFVQLYPQFNSIFTEYYSEGTQKSRKDKYALPKQCCRYLNTQSDYWNFLFDYQTLAGSAKIYG